MIQTESDKKRNSFSLCLLQHIQNRNVTIVCQSIE